MSFDIVVAVMLVAVTGCSDDVEPSPRLAIEAWIDSGGYPVVLLSQSLAPTAVDKPVSEAMVRWGRVTISDGDTTVNMIGGPDHAVFPPYSYRTYAMQGQVGRTYTIVAEYEGMRAEARSTILPPAEIDSVCFSRVGDGAYSGSVTFTSPVAAQYVLFTRVRNIETRHYPSFLGTVSVQAPGQSSKVPLYRGRHADLAEDYRPDFSLGDTVDVIVARVEPEVYNFWQAYQDQVYFGNKVFLSSPAQLSGNVAGGYGIFSARGVSRREVVVGDLCTDVYSVAGRIDRP